MVEVKERNEVSFAFAESMGKGVIVTDNYIPIFFRIRRALLLEAEALKSGIHECFVDGEHGRIYAFDFLGEFDNFVI